MLTFDFHFLLRCKDSVMPFQPQKMEISHVLIANKQKLNYFTDFTKQCCPEPSSILSAQFLRCVYMQTMLSFEGCSLKESHVTVQLKLCNLCCSQHEDLLWTGHGWSVWSTKPRQKENVS